MAEDGKMDVGKLNSYVMLPGPGELNTHIPLYPYMKHHVLVIKHKCQLIELIYRSLSAN